MKRCPAPSRKASRMIRVLAVVLLLGVVAVVPHALAGLGGFGNNAVGGVMIDPAGLVRSATLDERAALLQQLRNQVAAPQGDLQTETPLRMISLKKLQAAMSQSLANGGELPAEMRMLAGLQRIEYVFAYPETQDIVLAGPGEPWTVREDATVVGEKSGRPVLLLSDLLVAFRSVALEQPERISCSIEPTPEGRERLARLLSRTRLQPGQNPSSFEPALREAFGPQLVKLTGIPQESHFARVLVSADYQMKRLAMALEQAPVAGLPSYLEMAKNEKHSGNENPRWWMACNYDSLKHDADKLAWRISGPGVKTLTEQDAIGADGQASQTGRQSSTAKKWADLMTAQYDALSQKNAIFGELRNVMDMTLVATLIAQEGLDQVSGCDLRVLRGEGVQVPVPRYEVPKAVSPECSFIRGRTGWIVTASGGVDIDPYSVLEHTEIDPSVSGVREQADGTDSTGWWWNS